MVDKVLEDGRRAIKAQELLRRLQARDASFVAVNIVDSDPTASSVREGVVVARRQMATGQWGYTFPEALFLSLERSAGAKEVLEALRQRDPNISNVSLGLQGSERVFQVTREELSMNGESFMPRTYALSPAFVHGTVDEELAVASLTAANSAPSATTGTSVSGASYAGSAATGMLLGYMLGNAFRPNAGVRSIMSPQQQEERRAGATSGYSAAITNNARTVSISSRGRDSISRASKASPTSAARVGVSRGGSFSGTGARAGGYGGGS